MKLRNVLICGSIVMALAVSACAGTKNQTPPLQAPKQSTQETPPVVAKSIYYTANEGGGITRIDAATNTVMDTIPLDGAVHNVQISPDGKVLGATLVPKMQGHGSMEMNGFAMFYDSMTNNLIKKVEIGAHPAHVVFTQDGKYVLTTNNASNNVTVIDAKNYNVVQTVPTGKGPHGFRISQDSKTAYIANMGEDTVSVIDIPTWKETRRITVGKAPVTTAITSDGKILVATANAENILAIVDLTSDKVEKIAVGKGPAQVFIQYDNKYAFVANQGTEQSPSNTVSKVDLATKKVVATIEVGKGAHGVVTSNDNKFVYITNMYENTVSIIDNTTDKVIGKVEVGKTPNGITFKQ
ncbi:YncE family protein [Sporomusa sphaeroides DSM 2875]|uniref:YVTN family beta-propeller repeat protein n=1 Tax=Sporomusa sphaeroides TaxID=47679 RepID=UPI00202E0DB3|nr:YncE family protein [Sporomusa sphaeroides]MCM0757321.1 YncE family protein [Sporomusa sphaeroides DSM 2875]